LHQAKFSMPATLGLIAVHRRAGMAEFDGYLADRAARSFLDRVAMRLDAEVDNAYPTAGSARSR
jgi:2-methylcitrate dehydratase PrpD